MKRMLHSEHEQYNAREFPGTRQLCDWCDAPTGRCEYDSLYLMEGTTELGPLCEDCLEDLEMGLP